jgi:hypothetical protein
MNRRQLPFDVAGRLIVGLSRRAHALACGLSGHDLLLHVEPGRLSLRCISCPYETPGWALKTPPQRSTMSRRAALVEQRAQ